MIVNSHARRSDPAFQSWRFSHARARVSWTRSSARVASRVNAQAYRRNRGMAARNSGCGSGAMATAAALGMDRDAGEVGNRRLPACLLSGGTPAPGRFAPYVPGPGIRVQCRRRRACAGFPLRERHSRHWSGSGARAYWHTVPGDTNTSRVIAFACDTPFTVYANVPFAPSLNVNVAVPTAVRVTCAGSNGTALNAGPVVRYSVPVNTPALLAVAVTDSHSGVPSTS